MGINASFLKYCEEAQLSRDNQYDRVVLEYVKYYIIKRLYLGQFKIQWHTSLPFGWGKPLSKSYIVVCDEVGTGLEFSKIKSSALYAVFEDICSCTYRIKVHQSGINNRIEVIFDIPLDTPLSKWRMLEYSEEDIPDINKKLRELRSKLRR